MGLCRYRCRFRVAILGMSVSSERGELNAKRLNLIGGGGKKARRYRYRYLKRHLARRCATTDDAPPPRGAEVEREGRWRSPSVPLHHRRRVG